MKLDIEGESYFVDFAHSAPEWVPLGIEDCGVLTEMKLKWKGGLLEITDGYVKISNGSTVCMVEKVSAKEACWSGHAICSVHDTFSKRVGRKVSFTEAIQYFPPERRMKWWEAYFKMMPRDKG